MWHDSSTCDMTHSLVSQETSRDGNVRAMELMFIWHDASTCDMTHSQVTWLIHMWHDSFTGDMTHPHVIWLTHTVAGISRRLERRQRLATHDYATWLIHTCHDSSARDMTHPHVTWLIHRYPKEIRETAVRPGTGPRYKQVKLFLKRQLPARFAIWIDYREFLPHPNLASWQKQVPLILKTQLAGTFTTCNDHRADFLRISYQANTKKKNRPSTCAMHLYVLVFCLSLLFVFVVGLVCRSLS